MSENFDIKDSVLYVKELCCRKDGGIDGGRELKNISFSFGRKGIHGILAPKHSGKACLWIFWRAVKTQTAERSCFAAYR